MDVSKFVWSQGHLEFRTFLRRIFILKMLTNVQTNSLTSVSTILIRWVYLWVKIKGFLAQLKLTDKILFTFSLKYWIEISNFLEKIKGRRSPFFALRHYVSSFGHCDSISWTFPFKLFLKQHVLKDWPSLSFR
jgi:hypothetical protein